MSCPTTTHPFSPISTSLSVATTAVDTTSTHAPTTMTTSARPTLTTAEYELWRDFIHSRTGLYITPSRQHYLELRLWERIRSQPFDTYAEYFHYITHNPQRHTEWLTLLDTLLNNETSFFRHEPSFTALRQVVLPARLAERRRQHQPNLLLWSAGCSSGHEAYSLAMTVRDALDTNQWQVQVTGTDISQRALTKAKQGWYAAHEMRGLPENTRRRYFLAAENGTTTTYTAVETLRQHLHFGYLNLHDLAAYWPIGQDIIFCQNVLIYFQSDQRPVIVERLCRALTLGGYLFLGPAEVIGLRLPGVRLVRLENALIYQRVA